VSKQDRCCKCKQKDVVLIAKNDFYATELDWYCDSCYTTKYGKLEIDPRFDIKAENVKKIK